MPDLPSPLQLEDYRVLTACLEAADEKPEVEEQAIETRLSFGEHKDDPLTWQVDLEVRFGKTGKKITAPYHGRFRVVAVFAVHQSYPKEKREILVSVNGASIVYGVIRELISNLSARGPHGMYILPSVSFYKPSPGARPRVGTKRRLKADRAD